MEFKKAVKSQSKLRCAIIGPSGSGKTYSSLAISASLGDNIAFIDTERGSGSKYADRFNFDVIDLETPTINNYIEAINLARSNGYNVLIIDSMTHAWESLLDQVNQIAKKKYKNNTWSAWSEGTPLQKKFIDGILSYPGHVICTIRTKTNWVTETYVDKGGYTKSKPVKIGLAPEQKGNIEYEFDVVLEMDTDNMATVGKDRTGMFQGEIIEKPGAEFGKSLIDWLNSGVEIKLATADQIEQVNDLVNKLKVEASTVSKWFEKARVYSFAEMKTEAVQKCIDFLKTKIPANDSLEEPLAVQFDECSAAISKLSEAVSIDALKVIFNGLGEAANNQSVIDHNENMKFELVGGA